MAASAQQQAILAFTTAGHVFGLPVEQLSRAVHLPRLFKMPGLPMLVEGFFKMAEKVIPVLRLDRLLGLSGRPPGLYTPLVVLAGDDPLALMVDRVDDILYTDPQALAMVRPGYTFNDCVVGQVVQDDREIYLLAVANLLLAQERRCLEDLRRSVGERLESWEVSHAAN